MVVHVTLLLFSVENSVSQCYFQLNYYDVALLAFYETTIMQYASFNN